MKVYLWICLFIITWLILIIPRTIQRIVCTILVYLGLFAGAIAEDCDLNTTRIFKYLFNQIVKNRRIK